MKYFSRDSVFVIVLLHVALQYPRAARVHLPLMSFRQMKLNIIQKTGFFDLGHTRAYSTAEVPPCPPQRIQVSSTGAAHLLRRGRNGPTWELSLFCRPPWASPFSWLTAIRTGQWLPASHPQPAQFATLTPEQYIQISAWMSRRHPKFVTYQTGYIIFTPNPLPLCIVNHKRCITFQQEQSSILDPSIIFPLKPSRDQILLETTPEYLQSLFRLFHFLFHLDFFNSLLDAFPAPLPSWYRELMMSLSVIF